jgi:RNase P subunit RPR2
MNLLSKNEKSNTQAHKPKKLFFFSKQNFSEQQHQQKKYEKKASQPAEKSPKD